MKRRLKDNGLTLVLIGIFIATLAAQSVAGWKAYNGDQRDHKEQPIGYVAYLTTGNFVEGVFENWESEFLQMSSFILLTIFLFQKGSSESKDPEAENDVDKDPRSSRRRKDVPKAVQAGGFRLLLYENSLSLAFVALFFLSITLHAMGGAAAYSKEQKEHGGKPVSVVGYVKTPQFWYESMQNWQSEYLAVACMVLFSVRLRQRGSPESKPVDMPHAEMPSN